MGTLSPTPDFPRETPGPGLEHQESVDDNGKESKTVKVELDSID